MFQSKNKRGKAVNNGSVIYIFLVMIMWFWMLKNNYKAFTKFKKYVREINPLNDFLMKKLGLIPSLIISTLILIGFIIYLYLHELNNVIFGFFVALMIANIYESNMLQQLEKIEKINQALKGLYQMEK